MGAPDWRLLARMARSPKDADQVEVVRTLKRRKLTKDQVTAFKLCVARAFPAEALIKHTKATTVDEAEALIAAAKQKLG